jgi:hypothetical protein
VEPLEPLIGEWTMEASFPGAPAGHCVFDWMPGGRFVVQQWEVPVPEAPDGVAIIGFDEGRGSFLQHYFDSRGVARVYEMSIAAGEWRLWRTQPDFSPLDFAQRFTGTFSAGGDRIEGRWEIAQDGSTWELDFHLNYTRVRPAGPAHVGPD